MSNIYIENIFLRVLLCAGICMVSVFAGSLEFFEGEEITIKSEENKTVFITVDKEKKTILELEARLHVNPSAGMGNTLEVTVNGNVLTGDDLINKPAKFTSSRFPDGQNVFKNPGFFLFMCPNFEPFPESSRYYPKPAKPERSEGSFQRSVDDKLC